MQQRTASTSNNPVPPSSYPNQLRSAPGTVGFNSTPFQDPYQFPQVQPIPVGYNSPLQDPRQNPAAANIATRVAVANNLYPTPESNWNTRAPAPVSRVSSSSTSRTEGSDRNHTVEYYKLVPMSADDVNEQSPSSYHQSNAEPCENYDYIRPPTHGSTGGGKHSRRSNSEVVQPMATTSSRLPSTSQTESARGHQWGRSDDLTAYATQSSNQIRRAPFPGASHVSIQDTTINVIAGNMATHVPHVRSNSHLDNANPSERVKGTLGAIEVSKTLPRIPVSEQSKSNARIAISAPPSAVSGFPHRPTITEPNSPMTPLGYPSLTNFVVKGGFQNLLKRGIESHIPAYMNLRLFDGSDKAIPLWHAQPLLSGSNGRQRGIEVGDLVYIGDSGHVHVLFNILRSFKDNVDDGVNPPPDFYYRHLEIGTLPQQLKKDSDVQGRKCFFSDKIIRLTSEEGKSNVDAYHFKTKKGACNEGVLVLPHGAKKSVLSDEFFEEPAVKEHFLQYSPSWYEHARRKYPKIGNGSLLLVVEAYLAKAWGIAALSMKNPPKEPLSIVFSQESPNDTFKYGWKHPENSWRTDIGTFRSGSQPQPPTAHCVGMKVYSLSLDDLTWSKHFNSKASSEGAKLSAPPSHGNTHPDSSADNTSSPVGSEGSLWSRISPRFLKGSKGDRNSNEGKGTSVNQLPPAMNDGNHSDYKLLLV
ncbi:hypothetical protein CPB84DRAFT_1775383 [Gymnopilus junonius]|uniref:Uncharacterized protein n=1 Tax=Gymnopilus junonius TaxID=109634 RepID=A0A9P5TPI0_GYMJU|nr:hypothetical protein CPB84DRAFT_1775383 [Gymnopilus junonius]